MKVMLGNILTVDKIFLTVIAKAEFILNSRPLVYGGSTSSPTDVNALTPNHFLHGCASANVSSGEFTERTCHCVVDGVIVSFWLTNSGTVGGRSTCHI